jgi:hypothetical protein
VTPKEYSAAEAKRLLDELKPYFDMLEKDALEQMVATTTWDEESDRKRRYFADHVKVIRDVQSKLKSIITIAAPNVRARGHV